MKSDCELEVGAGFYSFLLFEMIGYTEQYFLRLNQKYSSEKIRYRCFLTVCEAQC